MNVVIPSGGLFPPGLHGEKPDSWANLPESVDSPRLLALSRAIIERNTRSEGMPWAPLRGVEPAPSVFPGIWNWDAAFIAMAAVRWDPELAREQLRIFFNLQKEDGFYPDCWRENGAVFCGCTKPPVMAWAVWRIHRASPDRAFLKEAYDSLVRNEAWWRTRRGGESDGLFHYDGNIADTSAGGDHEEERKIFAGWESGMDDSPRWDGCAWHLWPIDLNCWMVLTYRCLAEFAEELELSGDASIWRQRERELARRIEECLWDAETGCYFDWDFVKNRFSRVLTPASYIPLFVGVASAEHAAAMADMAKRLSPCWPTVAYDEPSFDPEGYWRGRIWINMAYFALKGLKDYGYDKIADAGRNEILRLVSRDKSTIYENYESKNGNPIGARDFGWSCTFVIDFILDWNAGGTCP